MEDAIILPCTGSEEILDLVSIILMLWPSWELVKILLPSLKKYISEGAIPPRYSLSSVITLSFQME